MLLVSILSPFQWSIICFLIVQIIALIKFFIWIITKIELLNNEMKDNCKRDEENKRDVNGIRKEERQNYKEISKRLDLISQGLVRVEEKVSHVEKQLDR